MALRRGEYPKLSTPLGLFPRGLKASLGEITLVGLTILDISSIRRLFLSYPAAITFANIL
jgi:hypothetical protein